MPIRGQTQNLRAKDGDMVQIELLGKSAGPKARNKTGGGCKKVENVGCFVKKSGKWGSVFL